MSGNKNVVIDDCFNINSKPKTITREHTVLKTALIDDNDNALLKMEISGSLNVKCMASFDGFLISSIFSRISRSKMI